ncbi:MAG: hypothetical protein F4X32_07760 [Candidatus Dadabacteria bacterium]|nr:hypothetical protein [Candidatus Dadabacteria bacterium]
MTLKSGLHFTERSGTNKFPIGVLFFLLTVFPAVPYSGAVTIKAIYADVPGVGFNDMTGFTDEERALLADNGNNASTLGEARKNAFEHAAGLLERKLPGQNTIRIEVSFGSFEDENTVATTYMRNPVSFGPEELLHIAYPPALAEKITGRALIDESVAHFIVKFSRHLDFHYGFRGEVSPFSIDFVALVTHEIIHGLGFHSSLEEDGSFPSATLDVTGGTRSFSLDVPEWQRIYDVQMYSEEDGEFIVDLPPRDRERAITSDTGLLWDGTARPGAENSCSYGQRMAELKSTGVAPDGKPRLYAPPAFEEGSSITHVHTDAEDIMEYLYPFPVDMDLSLAMLKDMGWEVSDEGFPPSCVPTGISVTPTSGLVTTEGGGTAAFQVKLESEPISDVIIPLRSSHPSEGTADTRALSFTPDDWEVAKTVTVTGTNDSDEDGARRYAIVLERAQSRDRFYDGFDPDDVSLINQDNDPEPDTPSPGPMPPQGEETGQGGSGCAIAAEEQVRDTSRSGVLARFLPAVLLVFAIWCRSLRREKRHLVWGNSLPD